MLCVTSWARRARATTTYHNDEPPGWLPYEVSKAPKNRLVYALGHKLKDKNIPVIGVSPGDPDAMRHSGKIMDVGELAEIYGFTDLDGRQPQWHRQHLAKSVAMPQSVTSPMFPIAVGDLHGRLDLLNAVIGCFSGRQFVFLGDFVDRGPHSRACLARVRELVEQGRAVACLGNHDQFMIDVALHGLD